MKITRKLIAEMVKAEPGIVGAMELADVAFDDAQPDCAFLTVWNIDMDGFWMDYLQVFEYEAETFTDAILYLYNACGNE